MSQKTLSLLFAFVVLVGSGCTRQSSPEKSDWEPKTALLDEIPRTDPKMIGFVHDVKAFYENLHNKRWAETYKQRVLDFRRTVPEDVYVKEVTAHLWQLDDYEVLPPIQSYPPNRVVTICRFVEGPIEHISYNNVTWTLEDGVWRCDCAGPTRISLFTWTRSQ